MAQEPSAFEPAQGAPYFGLPPLQDRALLLPLEEIKATISNLKLQKEALERRILSASALLNYQPPINRLPPELLVEDLPTSERRLLATEGA